MKSEERHELKTNELADWIANFPQWARENTGTIAYVIIVLIIVGVVAYLKWYRPSYSISAQQLEATQLVGQLEIAKLRLIASQNSGFQSPEIIRSTADRLDAIASQLKDPENAAFALIKRGEALRSELHYAGADFAKDPNAIAFQIDKAKSCYEDALQKAGSDPQLAAAAQFGLGLCQEELGNWDEAKKIYDEIAASEKYAGTIILPMARDRAADMSDYKGKFVFVETPKPAPAAPAMPLGPRIQAAPKSQAPAAPSAAPVKQAQPNTPPAK
jgi:tetratricopeptide (TPR) repeat protein